MWKIYISVSIITSIHEWFLSHILLVMNFELNLKIMPGQASYFSILWRVFIHFCSTCFSLRSVFHTFKLVPNRTLNSGHLSMYSFSQFSFCYPFRNISSILGCRSSLSSVTLFPEPSIISSLFFNVIRIVHLLCFSLLSSLHYIFHIVLVISHYNNM